MLEQGQDVQGDLSACRGMNSSLLSTPKGERFGGEGVKRLFLGDTWAAAALGGMEFCGEMKCQQEHLPHPPTGLVLPLPVLLLRLFPKSPQPPPNPWSAGLGFTAQLAAPQMCQQLSCPEPLHRRRGLFQRVLLPVLPPQQPSLPPPIVLPGCSGHPWGTPKLRFGCVIHPSSTAPALRRWEGLSAAAPFPCSRVPAASPGHGARPFPL